MRRIAARLAAELHGRIPRIVRRGRLDVIRPFETLQTRPCLVESALPHSITDWPPAVAIVGELCAGKTTLIEHLIPALQRLGLRVETVKHHAHAAEPDTEGTNTARYGRAGAVETLLTGPGATVVRHLGGSDPWLGRVLQLVRGADLVLIEGYRQSPLPKVLVHREGLRMDRPGPAGPIIAHVGTPLAGGDAAPAGEAGPFRWDQIDELAAELARCDEGAVAGARTCAAAL